MRIGDEPFAPSLEEVVLTRDLMEAVMLSLEEARVPGTGIIHLSRVGRLCFGCIGTRSKVGLFVKVLR